MMTLWLDISEPSKESAGPAASTLPPAVSIWATTAAAVVEIPIAVDDLDVCDHIAGHDWLSLPVEPGVSLTAGIGAPRQSCRSALAPADRTASFGRAFCASESAGSGSMRSASRTRCGRGPTAD